MITPLLEPGSGLLRKQAFRGRLRDEIERADADGRAFSVLLFEGRPLSGPRLRQESIEAAACLLTTSAREVDSAARLGPRLFAVLLAGVDGAIAGAVAQAIHASLLGWRTGDSWAFQALTYPADSGFIARLLDRRVVISEEPSARAAA